MKKQSNDWKYILLIGLFCSGVMAFFLFDGITYLTGNYGFVYVIVYVLFIIALRYMFLKSVDYDDSVQLHLNIPWYKSINWTTISVLILFLILHKKEWFPFKYYLVPVFVVAGYFVYRFYKGSSLKTIHIGIKNEKIYFEEENEVYYSSIENIKKVTLNEKEIKIYSIKGCSDKLDNYKYSDAELNDMTRFLERYVPEVNVRLKNIKV